MAEEPKTVRYVPSTEDNIVITPIEAKPDKGYKMNQAEKKPKVTSIEKEKVGYMLLKLVPDKTQEQEVPTNEVEDREEK